MFQGGTHYGFGPSVMTSVGRIKSSRVIKVWLKEWQFHFSKGMLHGAAWMTHRCQAEILENLIIILKNKSRVSIINTTEQTYTSY